LSLLKTWFAPRQPSVGTVHHASSGDARLSRLAKEFGPDQVLKTDRSGLRIGTAAWRRLPRAFHEQPGTARL